MGTDMKRGPTDGGDLTGEQEKMLLMTQKLIKATLRTIKSLPACQNVELPVYVCVHIHVSVCIKS